MRVGGFNMNSAFSVNVEIIFRQTIQNVPMLKIPIAPTF